MGDAMSAPHAADAAAVGPAEPGLRPRIASIDIIRGAVMVLMAIDHVRVYAGVPAGGPDAAVFFTRWITHFCAPAFLFLAGTSAFFYGRAHGGLSRFLFTRGVWLILLELTVLRVAWTFNADFASYMMAGVIWVIGWCMILMALLVRLRPHVVGAIGLAIIALHNAVLPVLMGLLPESLGWLRSMLYDAFFTGPIRAFGATNLIVLYAITPWLGVMAAGYGFATLLVLEPGRRDRLCLRIGLAAIALFVVLRALDVYGDPSPWRGQLVARDWAPAMPAPLAFLNTTKYPASLSFLLMTLGPTIALVPLLERVRGALARWMTVFGRVPFFFYVLHIPLIHALALLASLAREGAVNPWLFANHPMGAPPPPDGYAWGLPLLYAVWAVAVVALYVPCRWFADLKARRQGRWLSYL
jgi:uncharacterized membrane protein